MVAMALPLDKPQALVSGEDIGRAAVAVASEPVQHIGKAVDLIADSQSLAQMAAVIGDVTGKPTSAVSVPLAALQETWPQGISLYRWLSERNDEDDIQALPRLIGTTVTFRQWAERYLLSALD
jgi:uncharacterized protein YbjT (DUF2867 family)